MAKARQRRASKPTSRRQSGITNRPAGEELRNQERVPARGRRKSGDRPMAPAPVRQRGRRAEPTVDAQPSTTPAARPVAAYGRRAPANARATKSTTGPGERAPVRKPNRRGSR
jgi:hypothetical protein